MRNPESSAISTEAAISSSGMLTQNIPEVLTAEHKEKIALQYTHSGLPKERVIAAIDALTEANQRLRANSNFRRLYGSLSPYSALPLMIKESLLDNNRVSKTGALGYFQLKPDAITDARQKLRALKITKEYDPKDPVDNTILGLIFFDDTQIRLQKEITVGGVVPPHFSLFAYNAGVDRTAKLIRQFQEEKKMNNIPGWSEFVKWLAEKIDSASTSKKEFSNEYNSTFTNWFSKDWSQDDSEISIGRTKIKKSKIQEVVNYVEKINAIAATNQSQVGRRVLTQPSSTGPKPSITPSSPLTPSAPSSSPSGGKEQVKKEIASSSKILPYNVERDVYRGENWFKGQLYNLKRWVGNNKKYRQIQAVPGKGLDAMLREAGVPVTPAIRDEFYDINDLEKGASIQVGAYYLLPNVPTAVGAQPASPPTLSPQVLKPEKVTPKPSPSKDVREVERLRRDFYAWLDTIEVKDNSLRGKLFILDPGHGGRDPGAVPIVYDASKTPVPYRMSDIAGAPGKEKLTDNGKGDGYLRVIEARVVMDVAYRVAKHLKEHGAEVKITHYFQGEIDNSIITQSSSPEAPGLIDEFEYYDTVGDGSKAKFEDTSIGGLHKRVRIRNKMLDGKNPKDSFFISLHADSALHNGKLVPNILYEPGNEGQWVFAHRLATTMGSIRNMKTKAGTRTTGIYILKSRYGAIDQNVLIEIGNMNHPNTAYALRSPKTRQDYAEGIAKGLIGVAIEPKTQKVIP